MSVPAASFERKGAARGRELAASMDFVRGCFEAVFAPRKFERLDERVDTFRVRMNCMRFRHSVDGREVQTGGSTRGYLDPRIRRLFSSAGDHRPSLSLFRRPKGSVVVLRGRARARRAVARRP